MPGRLPFAGGLFAAGMAPYQIIFIGILGGAFIIFGGCTFGRFIGPPDGPRGRRAPRRGSSRAIAAAGRRGRARIVW